MKISYLTYLIPLNLINQLICYQRISFKFNEVLLLLTISTAPAKEQTDLPCTQLYIGHGIVNAISSAVPCQL